MHSDEQDTNSLRLIGEEATICIGMHTQNTIPIFA